MLTRTEYLKIPEQWHGTDDEKELVNFCMNHIFNEPNFSYDFSPIAVIVTKDEKIEFVDNFFAKERDLRQLTLSKEVLKRYKNGKN
jgi:hypothetical protein